MFLGFLQQKVNKFKKYNIYNTPVHTVIEFLWMNKKNGFDKSLNRVRVASRNNPACIDSKPDSVRTPQRKLSLAPTKQEIGSFIPRCQLSASSSRFVQRIAQIYSYIKFHLSHFNIF